MKSHGAYWAPILDRFVSGLMYPAFLGTNVVLLLEVARSTRLSANRPLLAAWVAMLVLFVADYLAVSWEYGRTPVRGSPLLSVLDAAAALFFFRAHILFADGASSGKELAASEWSTLWTILVLLQVSYVCWYLLAYTSADRRIEPGARVIADRYKHYLRLNLVFVVVQLLVIGLAALILSRFLPHYASFIACCGLMFAGWLWRQAIEYRLSPLCDTP